MAADSKKVFKRIEKKYLLSGSQYDNIIDTIRLHTEPDVNRNERIFSLYFDTPTDLLIRRSIDKPVYKEKLRLRAYGMPDENAQVFAEIKKKYKKVVYKRRAVMKFSDARKFLATGNIPDGYENQHQILSEIQWFVRAYPGLAPSILVSYEREAYFGKDEPNLRITFDSNLLWRDMKGAQDETGADGLSIADSIARAACDADADDIAGAYDMTSNACVGMALPIIDSSQRIMEIKIPGAMPLWLVRLLTENEIYPTSFSKVGTAYKQRLSTKLAKGELHYD